MVQNKKVLLHACCGICSAYPIKFLIENNYNPLIFFSNSNLDTQSEYNLRLNAQKKLCEYYKIELIIDNYLHDEFLNYVQGFENEPEKGKRCIKCMEYRLLKTAQKAKELSINTFTTSLSISPHKNFELINQIGKEIATELNIEFLEANFKKNNGYLKSINNSKLYNIYRQNYCGCNLGKKKGE